MTEQFESIIEYNGEYQIGNLGNVKSVKTGIILKPYVDNKGYLRVHLWKDNKRKYYKIHKLVAHYFLGESELTVDHIDENKTNNKSDNLQYIPNDENVRKGKKKHNTSGYSGVENRGKSFRARIKIEGKRVGLGSFIHPYWAHLVYQQKLRNIL